MQCIQFAFSLCFMHLDVCLNVENCVLFGLDWVEPMMPFLLARHMFMHSSCIRTLFSFLLLVLCCDYVFCFSLSLSLSQIDCTWHPSANPLRLRTLFVLGHLLLILLLFISRFVMRRPVSTSRRTSPIVVFIRNATWFYRTFPILLYPFSFIIRDGNLYVRYP